MQCASLSDEFFCPAFPFLEKGRFLRQPPAELRLVKSLSRESVGQLYYGRDFKTEKQNFALGMHWQSKGGSMSKQLKRLWLLSSALSLIACSKISQPHKPEPPAPCEANSASTNPAPSSLARVSPPNERAENTKTRDV